MIKKLNYIFSTEDKIKIVLLTIMILIGSMLELLAISLFSPFIDGIMDQNAMLESTIISYIYRFFSFEKYEYFLAGLAGSIIVIYIVKNVYIIVQKNTIYRFAYSIQRTISTNLLKAYMKEPYTFHLNKNIAVLQRSMQEDTDQFAKAILHFMEMSAEACVCIVLGVYLFIVSKSITVVIAGLLIVCLAIFSYINKKYSRKWGEQGQEYKAKIYQWMNQSLSGIKDIKILDRSETFINNYDNYMKKYVRVLRLNRLIGIMPKYIIEMVCMTGLLLAVMVKMFFGQKELTEFVPQLAIFAVAAFRLLPSVGRINEHLSAVIFATPSIDLIYHDLKEIEDLHVEEMEKDETWHFQKKIEVKRVTYAYPGGEGNVIENACFEIDRGETIAFVGTSGAGKSTMVDILLGLLPPQQGKILVDGMNVYKNLLTWQKEIGYIPQTIYLSDDTIRNNVAFGIEEDEIDEQAVIVALQQAQLFDFVDTLPEGLDTCVGDRGVRLSGGQRQRIGIARALYHNPEILVLDEATSALDNDTEAAVMEAIDCLKGQKTILIIAHRLTTIKNADKIFEVKDGKVEKKEQGRKYVMRSKNEVLSQIAYWCFYAAVIIEACMVIIDKSNYTNPIEGRLFQLTFLLFLLKVCLTKYTWKEYFCIFLFCILGAISYFVTGRNEIVRLVIFVAACKEVDIRKCMKLVFWITLSGCLVIIGLSVTGIYGGLSLTQDYGRGMVETRYTLGMGHPNALQCMVWSMTVLGMYLYGVRMKWWHYLMILALNIFFFWLTDSRTSLLVTIYAIILVFIVIRSPNAWREKVISWIGIITSVGSIGISILTAAGAYRVYDYIWYDDRSPITLAFYYLNKILNGRIRTLVGTTRFEGTVQTWHLFSGPENNYFFDMGWIRLFYWYGIIPGCVFVAAIAVLLIYFYKKNDFMSIVLIASICLYTITEAHVISVYLARNYIFFLIGAVWYEVIKGPASRKNENIWERENSIGRIN